MKESDFQKSIIDGVEEKFPGTIVLKTDPRYKQGIPDLIILYKKHWAALECKKSKNAHRQPNQDHYIQKMNKMSYASFIYPENRKEVMDELQRSFKVKRTAC